MERREFLRFMGVASALGVVGSAIGNKVYSFKNNKRLSEINYEGIPFSDLDEVVLSKELQYDILIKWGEEINDKDTFGFNKFTFNI